MKPLIHLQYVFNTINPRKSTIYPLTHLSKNVPIVMIEHHDLCKNYAYHKIKIAFSLLQCDTIKTI